ncbi:MAG: hypothetical protein K0Q53_1412 [Massilibacillus sp.]|jgi:hypothetical protein|nr:hypothetical protein [Massilibacillus sp.]
MKTGKITKWLAVLTSFSLLVLPKIFPVCAITGKSLMRCFFTYQVEFMIALLAFIIALSLFFIKEVETKQLTGFLLFLIGMIIIVLPTSWGIGICEHDGSPCHITAAWTGGTAVILALSGLIDAWSTVRQSSREEEKHT